MRTLLWLLFVAIVYCLPGVRAAHADKKVYKCANADGSLVFSPNPCGASAQELKVDAGSAAPADAPATPVTSAPTPGSTPAALPDSAEDSKCRNDAQRLVVYPAEGNLQALMQHQSQLVRDYAAGQNASEAIKVQIGNLDGTIAAEQQRLGQARDAVDRIYRSAIAKCDARKAEREREAERKSQAEHDLQKESERQAAQKRQAEQDEEAKHPHDPNGG